MLYRLSSDRLKIITPQRTQQLDIVFQDMRNPTEGNDEFCEIFISPCINDIHRVSSKRVAKMVLLYEEHKHDALCIDIETTRYNGSIAVLGAYRPASGVIVVEQLVRGQNLSRESVKKMFFGVKLLITFNGTKHDIRKIMKSYPGIIDHLPHLDLYLLAKELGMGAGLKMLETQFHIFREEPYVYWRRKAIKLWKGHLQGNPKSLPALLKYNANDCVNLYPLAEELARLFWRKWMRERVSVE